MLTSLQATDFPLYSLLFAVPVILILLLAFSLFTAGAKSLLNGLLGISGIIYISIPFALLTMLGNPAFTEKNYRPWIILGYFILMWVYDVFAYLSGSLLGKHPLYKSISPKKSREGFIGGSLFTIAAAYPVFLLSGEFNWMHWGVIALIIVTFGTLGDLAESLLKRQAEVKDSGHIMPGHGGVLDRFDGVLLSAPAVLCYIILFAE
ncbi:MAG: phosphatidate cytidylyltransferase [Bacteroidota bacterium]|nr:phosphatidate cytidylyltransferase [Bacteroidota bacterium]